MIKCAQQLLQVFFYENLSHQDPQKKFFFSGPATKGGDTGLATKKNNFFWCSKKYSQKIVATKLEGAEGLGSRATKIISFFADNLSYSRFRTGASKENVLIYVKRSTASNHTFQKQK